MILEGSDFAELGGLTGQVQERLQIMSINFSVSAEKHRAVENDSIAQASEIFERHAELVRKQLAAKSYRIVDFSINTGGAKPSQ